MQSLTWISVSLISPKVYEFGQISLKSIQCMWFTIGLQIVSSLHYCLCVQDTNQKDFLLVVMSALGKVEEILGEWLKVLD